jgi:hypothetical protein
VLHPFDALTLLEDTCRISMLIMVEACPRLFLEIAGQPYLAERAFPVCVLFGTDIDRWEKAVLVSDDCIANSIVGACPCMTRILHFICYYL